MCVRVLRACVRMKKSLIVKMAAPDVATFVAEMYSEKSAAKG